MFPAASSSSRRISRYSGTSERRRRDLQEDRPTARLRVIRADRCRPRTAPTVLSNNRADRRRSAGRAPGCCRTAADTGGTKSPSPPMTRSPRRRSRPRTRRCAPPVRRPGSRYPSIPRRRTSAADSRGNRGYRCSSETRPGHRRTSPRRDRGGSAAAAVPPRPETACAGKNQSCCRLPAAATRRRAGSNDNRVPRRDHPGVSIGARDRANLRLTRQVSGKVRRESPTSDCRYRPAAIARGWHSQYNIPRNPAASGRASRR